MLSTRELCEMLDIERSWVSRYLRHLGNQWPEIKEEVEEVTRANLRTVYYDESEVLAYLNENAVFSRQTEYINLGEFLSPKEIDDLMEKLQALDSKDNPQPVISEFLAGLDNPPEGIVPIPDIGGFARNRGLLEWRAVNDVSIESLEDLMSMPRGISNELIYRDNFRNARITVRVHGHTWYMSQRQENEFDSNFWVLCVAGGD